MEPSEGHHIREEIRRVERDLGEDLRSDRTQARANFYFTMKMILAVALATEIFGFAILIASRGH